jgi:hypothetical protein
MPNFPSKHKKQNSKFRCQAGGITALDRALFISRPHYALFTVSRKLLLIHLASLYREKTSEAVDEKYDGNRTFERWDAIPGSW